MDGGRRRRRRRRRHGRGWQGLTPWPPLHRAFVETACGHAPGAMERGEPRGKWRPRLAGEGPSMGSGWSFDKLTSFDGLRMDGGRRRRRRRRRHGRSRQGLTPWPPLRRAFVETVCGHAPRAMERGEPRGKWRPRVGWGGSVDGLRMVLRQAQVLRQAHVLRRAQDGRGSPAAKASTASRARSSVHCSGGDFMK